MPSAIGAGIHQATIASVPTARLGVTNMVPGHLNPFATTKAPLFAAIAGIESSSVSSMELRLGATGKFLQPQVQTFGSASGIRLRVTV